ncbi:MAG: hypothetical protein NVS3B17_04540 [Vulcanimicrobiaceae bacterium]
MVAALWRSLVIVTMSEAQHPADDPADNLAHDVAPSHDAPSHDAAALDLEPTKPGTVSGAYDVASPPASVEDVISLPASIDDVASPPASIDDVASPAGSSDDVISSPASSHDEPSQAAVAQDDAPYGIAHDDTMAVQAHPDVIPPTREAPSEGSVPVARVSAGDAGAEANATSRARPPRALGIDPAVEERRLRAQHHWDAIVAAKQTHATFIATVTKTTNGGLLVDVGGVRGFLPASQIRVDGDATLPSLVDTKLTVTVVDVDLGRRRIVVSQRRAAEAARRSKRTELLRSLAIGQTHEANVVRLVPFGAFVDIGGVEGLVPMSELALERVEKVEDLLKVGDRFPASIIRIDEGGRKIALSRKNALPDPWRDHPDVVRPGAVVEGIVVAKEAGPRDAGLRVEIAPGIVGSIRDSDANPDEYEIGERVEVTVKFADRRTRRIRLGTAYASPPPTATASGFAPLGTELRKR